MTSFSPHSLLPPSHLTLAQLLSSICSHSAVVLISIMSLFGALAATVPVLGSLFDPDLAQQRRLEDEEKQYTQSAQRAEAAGDAADAIRYRAQARITHNQRIRLVRQLRTHKRTAREQHAAGVSVELYAACVPHSLGSVYFGCAHLTSRYSQLLCPFTPSLSHSLSRRLPARCRVVLLSARLRTLRARRLLIVASTAGLKRQKGTSEQHSSWNTTYGRTRKRTITPATALTSSPRQPLPYRPTQPPPMQPPLRHQPPPRPPRPRQHALHRSQRAPVGRHSLLSLRPRRPLRHCRLLHRTTRRHMAGRTEVVDWSAVG